MNNVIISLHIELYDMTDGRTHIVDYSNLRLNTDKLGTNADKIIYRLRNYWSSLEELIEGLIGIKGVHVYRQKFGKNKDKIYLTIPKNNKHL